MVMINTSATAHGSKTENYAGGTSIAYNVFPETTQLDKDRLAKVKKAVAIVDRLSKKLNATGACNRYFKTLGKNKSFTDFWSDNTIFINFSPSNTSNFYGATHSNDKDMCLSAWCIDSNNRWMVAATIVHELAHIAGAPGGASHNAEQAVDRCYFINQYDSNIMGSIFDIENMLRSSAAA